MSNRVQVKNPLASASPGLTPGRALAPVRPGATPAPQGQPLFALADALRDFNPELRQLVRDRLEVARSEALSAGELKAQELGALEGMKRINTDLKGYVEDGTISNSQLPFFQIGFKRRIGSEFARTEFNQALESRLSEATRVGGRVDPRQIFQETYSEFRGRFPEGDIYSAQGFDETAQDIGRQFERRADSSYERNYETAAKVRIANEGIEIVNTLMASDLDDRPALREQLKGLFSSVKEDEMPKAEVAPFFAASVMLPAVRDLASRGELDEAEDLLDEFAAFDVTGEGGLMGKMGTTLNAFTEARQFVEAKRRSADDPDQVAAKKLASSIRAGESAAREALVGLDGANLTQARYDSLRAQYREATDDAQSIYYFEKTLEQEMRQGGKDDADAVAQVVRLASSLKTQDLNDAEDLLESSIASGRVSNLTAAKTLEPLIRASRAKSGIKDPRWYDYTAKDLYQQKVDGGLGTVPAFNGVEEFEALPDSLKDRHREIVMDYWSQRVDALLSSYDSPEEAAANVGKVRDTAFKDALAFAEKTTKNLINEGRRLRREAITEDLKRRTWVSRKVPTTESFFSAYYVTGRDERDRKILYSPDSVDGLPEDLKALAVHVPKSSPARFKYVWLKSSQGIALEEMEARMTAEGIPLDPSKLDYRSVKLFASKTELEKEYANGQFEPGGKFARIGDLVDPHNILTAQELYHYQLALFTAQK